jgi:hypothetical protein
VVAGSRLRCNARGRRTDDNNVGFEDERRRARARVRVASDIGVLYNFFNFFCLSYDLQWREDGVRRRVDTRDTDRRWARAGI